jgi:AcrR family transcriptional regulator
MSTATADKEIYEPPRADSEPAPSGVFPQAVNWGNPRVAAILETAAQCFSRGGFSTTTLADIGRELGLRKSIVHYYFTSKATLVREVQNFAYGRYLEVIRSAVVPAIPGSMSESSPAVSYNPGLAGLWSRLRDDRSVRGLNLELWSEARRNGELSERAESFEAEAQRLISEHFVAEKGITREDAQALATLTLAVLDGLTVREERDGAAERSARAFDVFYRLISK